jgi:hypothetical protein
MSHTHFCDIAGHHWQCDSSECICICEKPMEQGDHSRCSIELRACSQHADERCSIVSGDQGAPVGLQQLTADGHPAMQTEQPQHEDWVRLEPMSPEIDQKLGEWFYSERDSIGFCFLCGNAIPTESDLIPDTNTHNCAEGQLFEEYKKIRRGQL